MTESKSHRGSKATARRCGDLIARLQQEKVIPEPFYIEEFIARFQAWRGRGIRLQQIDVDQPTTGLPCGVLVKTTTTDHIFYMPGTTPLHREHIIVHELAHMLFEHENDVSAFALESILFPDLDPQLVEQILNRAAYTTREEREAETFASLFLQQVHRDSPSPSHAPLGSARVLNRVENAWGRSKRWRR